MARGGDRSRQPSGGASSSRSGSSSRRSSSAMEIEYELVERDSLLVNKRWSAARKLNGVCSNVLGQSLVTEETIRSLLREGKLSNRDTVRLPSTDETEPHPMESEVVAFVAYLEAGLRFPSALFVGEVLRVYGLELAIL